MRQFKFRIFNFLAFSIIFSTLNLFANCDEAILLECGSNGIYDTRIGNSNYGSSDYVNCYNGPSLFNGNDVLFKIVKTDYKMWTISIFNMGNVDLDMFLLDNCFGGGIGKGSQINSVTCLDKSINGVNEVFSGYNYDAISISNPGTYYIVVDGYNQNQNGLFTYNVGCDDFVHDDFQPCNNSYENLECNIIKSGFVGCNCPPGTICVCDQPKMNNYSCLPEKQKGSMTSYENIYSFTADNDGEYIFEISELTQNLDVFIISNYCDPQFNGTSDYNCIAMSTNQGRENETIILEMKQGQTVYIVVDGRLDATSDYKIFVKCPGLCDAECCLFPNSFSKCFSFENYLYTNIFPQGNPDFSVIGNTTDNNALIVNTPIKRGLKSAKFSSKSNLDLNINRNIPEIKPTRLEWWIYVPSSKSSHWHLKTNNISNTPILMEIQNGIGKIGFGNILSPNFIDSFPIKNDTWIKHVLIFQPDENEIEFWFDGRFVFKESNFQSNRIGQLNFNNKGINTEYYVDEICYSEFLPSINCSEENNPVCYNSITFKNECYALFKGYTSCEKKCNDLPCDDCWDCFHYLPDDNDPSICRFTNSYCEKPRQLNLKSPDMEVYDYDWSVTGGSFNYQNGTSRTSANPIIKFPSSGNYNVCMKVYYTDSFGSTTLVYECCQTIIVNVPCTSPPVAHFTYTFNNANNSFTLNSNTSTGVTNRLWDFGDNYGTGSQITFLQSTNNTSISPSILLPPGYCKPVCLSVVNSCGISTYCVTLCRDNNDCTGNTPVYSLNQPVSPVINDQSVSFASIPAPPSGTNVEYSWDFGDGVGKSSIHNPTYTYPRNGNFLICLVIKIGCKSICYCWSVRINPCNVTFEPHTGTLSAKFGGDESSLIYNISSSGITLAPGQPWMLDRVPINNSVGNSNLSIPLPQNRDYEICFPYIKPNGCLAYKCIPIRGGNPFSCPIIGWKYHQNSGYQFTLPEGYSEINWTLDESGQNLGTSTSSNYVIPLNPCGWRTISVIYFDGTRYSICCLRIYLCAPDDCFGNVYYGVSNENAQFQLNESGVSNISWYFDDAPNSILGSTSVITIPFPSNCVQKWISVKFKDALGRWKLCCRLIWFCNPFNCNQINMAFDENNGYRFEIDQSYTDMSWTIDETGQSLGSNIQSNYLPLPPGNCSLRTATIRYKDALGRWWICCYRFWWCDPTNCGDKIFINPNGTNFTLNTDNSAQNITWYLNNVVIGSGNNLTTTLPNSGTNKIYIRYFDSLTKCWYWCCKTHSSNNSNLSFDIDDNVCSSVGQIVTIPIRVKNFTNVTSFQFTLNVADNTKGEIITLDKGNIIGDLNYGLLSPTIATVVWDHTSSVNLTDNTAVINLNLRIKAPFTGSSDINIVGTPTNISAEQNNQTVIPIVSKGSFCASVNSYKICGKITREDNVAVPNVEVTISGGKNAVTNTNAIGNYCFENLNGGLSYTITPSKNTDYKFGVNSGDVSAIRRHILGLEKFNSPYKIIAADPTRNYKVNTGDVTEIRQLILGIIPKFSNSMSWTFVPKSHVFNDPAEPFTAPIPNTITINNLNDNHIDKNFIGIKVGDVNLDKLPTGLQENVKNRSMANINLIVGSANVSKNQNFDINISVRQFIDITSGQFSVNWATNLFDFVSLKNMNSTLGINNDNFNATITSSGKLGFLWEDYRSATLPDDAILFTIGFKSKSNGTATINITDDPVDKYFEDKNKQEVNIIVTNGTITVPTYDDVIDSRVRFFPNPTSGIITIESDLREIHNLEIRSIDGKLMYFIPDLTTETIDLSHLNPGSYLLKGIVDDKTFSKKIVLIQ